MTIGMSSPETRVTTLTAQIRKRARASLVRIGLARTNINETYDKPKNETIVQANTEDDKSSDYTHRYKMVDNQLSTVDRVRKSTAVITKPKVKSNLKNKSILVINKEHTNKDINQSQNTNNDHQSKQVRFENVHDSNTVVTCTGQMQGSVKVKGQRVAELARDSNGVVYQESVENARDPVGKQGAAGFIRGCKKVRNRNSAGGVSAAEETNEQKCKMNDGDVNITHKGEKRKENSSMINQKACMKSVIAPDKQINEKKTHRACKSSTSK